MYQQIILENMKRFKLTIALLLLIIFTGFGQMKVLDGNGKTLSNPGITKNEIKISLNVPSDVKNHEIIQITAQLRSKTGNHHENYILGRLADGLFVKEYKSDFIGAKSSVSLALVNKDRKSDFTFNYYTGEILSFDPLLYIENNTERAERYYDLIIGIYGKDVESYKYVDDGWGNMVQEPIYKFTRLAEYKADYDAGEVSPFFVSTFGTMQLPKCDLNEYHLWKSPKGDVSALNFGKKDSDLRGEDEFSMETSKSSSESRFYIEGYTISSTKKSIEDIKKDIITNLVGDANVQSSSYQSTFVSSDRLHVHELCYTTNPAESSDAGETGKGIKGKFKELKSAFTTPTSFTEEMKEQKRIQAESMVKYVPAKLGNMSCEKTELLVYQERDLKYNSTAKVRELDPEKSGNSRVFEIYIGQKGDKIFVVWMLKRGDENELNESERSFRQKFLDEFNLLG